MLGAESALTDCNLEKKEGKIRVAPLAKDGKQDQPAWRANGLVAPVSV